MTRGMLMGLAALAGAAFQDIAAPRPPSRLLQQDERGGAPRPEGFVDDDRRIILAATVTMAPGTPAPTTEFPGGDGEGEDGGLCGLLGAEAIVLLVPLVRGFISPRGRSGAGPR